jgi:hypothetical protein
MISNIPAFAVHQDYQSRHSDMLAAARSDALPPDQVSARRKVNPFVYDKVKRTLVPNRWFERLASSQQNRQP